MEPVTAHLKVMLFNAENLFLLSDQPILTEHLELSEEKWQKLSTSVYDNKSLFKAKSIARLIQEEDPDLIMFCEVGGHESLKNFNRLFLNDRYLTALTEGNSDRNIDIGYLLRKNMGFYFDLVSNKNRGIQYQYPHRRDPAHPDLRFSRDAAELHLFVQDREHPFLIFVLTHLKSRLDPEGIDPNGFERRQAELRTLIDIYEELENRFQNKVPIAVAGDFNGRAAKTLTDSEFFELYKRTRLEDVCELATLPSQDRATYFQVGRAQKVEGRQLDYCFLSPQLANYLKKDSVRVHRFKDPRGLPQDPPSTLDAKSLLPSDHYPLVFELSGIPLF